MSNQNVRLVRVLDKFDLEAAREGYAIRSNRANTITPHLGRFFARSGDMQTCFAGDDHKVIRRGFGSKETKVNSQGKVVVKKAKPTRTIITFGGKSMTFTPSRMGKKGV